MDRSRLEQQETNTGGSIESHTFTLKFENVWQHNTRGPSYVILTFFSACNEGESDRTECKGYMMAFGQIIDSLDGEEPPTPTTGEVEETTQTTNETTAEEKPPGGRRKRHAHGRGGRGGRGRGGRGRGGQGRGSIFENIDPAEAVKEVTMRRNVEAAHR